MDLDFRMKYIDIIKQNKLLSKQLPEPKYKILIMSNVTNHFLTAIIEYTLRVHAIPAVAKTGGYDTIVQDSESTCDSDLIIIFWEIGNIMDGFQYKSDILSDEQLESIIEKVELEIDLVFQNLSKIPIVLINRFTAMPFVSHSIGNSNLEMVANRLNEYLENNLTKYIKIIDIEKVFAIIGLKKCIDLRHFYSSKALYTIYFYRAYAEYIKPLILSANGKAKKALIFDCDNTLWKGILGESGFNEIEMSPSTKDGLIFNEIQSIALALNRQGVLLGLCSKNNFADVKEVLTSHPDMLIREENLAIQKVNWEDKVSNLKNIARDLNIGLDSLVFIDDSTFEINLVKEQLPEVEVLQVPEKLSEYPSLIRNSMGLFYHLSQTAEDKKKTLMYKQQALRTSDRKGYNGVEDFLRALKLKIVIFQDNAALIPRMSQMTQKTNQFNLTTRRYTERDLDDLIQDPNSIVIAASVSDKYGDSGITGLCIARIDVQEKRSEIDSFLMSCRIIGRNIEYAIMDALINKLKKRGIRFIDAKYVKTPKNNIVEKFYDNCSFTPSKVLEGNKEYIFDIERDCMKQIGYIEVNYEK